MSDRTWQLIGIAGFVLSGVAFLFVGLRTDDVLTIVGSVTWIVACIAWGVPLLRPTHPDQG